MILATVDTGTYKWTTFAQTEGEAESLLEAAYDRHMEQIGDGLPGLDYDLMRNMIIDGDIEFIEAEVGVVLRDGSKL